MYIQRDMNKVKKKERKGELIIKDKIPVSISLLSIIDPRY